ncbi:MAG TPA: Flp pilus assembly protein CpaB [Xanthobacteraceae bacterium]|nr:Flp pilus assembly protein CpaB [Xanthobacteraceae bacterium]
MKAARLVVLTVAIAAGGVAAMLAGRTEKPVEVKVAPVPQMATVDVLVAKSDIAMGQTISPGDVRWQGWPADAASGNFIRKTDRPNAIENLSGSIARAPFVNGEPIRDVKLVNAKGSGFMAAILPSGMRAVSTQISPETGAGGFILPNDHVDVILTRRDRDADKTATGDTHSSETILTNVRVLAIDQNVQEKDGQKVVVGKTATLELTPSQAETLAVSQQLGTLSLALRSIADASRDGPNAEDVSSGRRNGVNIVRFGVGTVSSPK